MNICWAFDTIGELSRPLKLSARGQNRVARLDAFDDPLGSIVCVERWLIEETHAVADDDVRVGEFAERLADLTDPPRAVGVAEHFAVAAEDLHDAAGGQRIDRGDVRLLPRVAGADGLVLLLVFAALTKPLHAFGAVFIHLARQVVVGQILLKGVSASAFGHQGSLPRTRGRASDRRIRSNN